jgi:organic hydroperoxide reductase OsmC/OhrA
MAMSEHRYVTRTTWTGQRGRGTETYRSYARDHETSAGGRPPLRASSDPSFRGDPSRWNPELLLVAALSQCHMLWFLHLAAVSDVVVVGYTDEAEGIMEETADGGGRFLSVVLRPAVTVRRASMIDRAAALHEPASERCFIANSVNFPVSHEPVTGALGSAGQSAGVL